MADDGDFDYDDAAFDPRQFENNALGVPGSRQGGAVQVRNQHYDEEVSVSESASVMSPDSPPSHRGFSPSLPEASRDTMDSPSPSRLGAAAMDDPGSAAPSSPASPGEVGGGAGSGAVASTSSLPNAYNPQDYANLDVTPDVQDLFKYIGRYRPASIELETRLKPFIPDFIPALGSIDEFIKVPRPDGRPDWLGLKVLDEPAPQQSDPALLTLQLRQLSRQAAGDANEVVGKLAHGEAGLAKRLDAWIASTAQVHKSRGPGSLSYSNPMPDLDLLMAEWPPELEAALANTKLPAANLDLDLATYSQVVCGLMDVPVYGHNLLESLHLLCCLFLEFRSNPFFRQHVDSPDVTQRLGTGMGTGPPGSAAGHSLWSSSGPGGAGRVGSAASSRGM